MKHRLKYYGFLLSFLLTWIKANSQRSLYHPFPDSSAIWNFEVKVPFCWPGKEYYSITMKGDTVFGSLTYHKIYKPYIDVSNLGTCGIRIQTLGYLGALREDISQKKIYFRCKGCTTEALLYNFNLQTNDTIMGLLANTTTVVTVNQVDSVLIGNTYRKRWKLANADGAVIIEGIGSSYGLIHALRDVRFDDDYINLNCFTQNSITLLSATSGQCVLILGIDNSSEKYPDITLYPNPTEGKLFITLPSKESYEMKILSCYGQKILETKTNEETTQIDVSSLKAGVYMLSIGQGTKTKIKKFVKTN